MDTLQRNATVEDIVKRFWNHPVIRQCGSALLSDDDARQDLAVLLMKLIDRRGHIPADEINPYVSVVIRNGVLESARNLYKSPKPEVLHSICWDTIDKENATSDFADPDDILMAWKRLQPLTHGMPQSQRNMIFLRFVRGMEIEEVAETLGVKRRSVIIITSMGLSRMRKAAELIGWGLQDFTQGAANGHCGTKRDRRRRHRDCEGS